MSYRESRTTNCYKVLDFRVGQAQSLDRTDVAHNYLQFPQLKPQRFASYQFLTNGSVNGNSKHWVNRVALTFDAPIRN